MRARLLASLWVGLVFAAQHGCSSEETSNAPAADAGKDAPLQCGAQTLCGDACFDTATDPNHCGDCDTVCSGGVVCFDGVCDGKKPVDVAAGVETSCALLASGAVFCWGRNDFGQAGQDPSKSASCDGTPCVAAPTRVEGLPPASAVSVGKDEACARTKDGGVFCWGKSDYGVLGHPRGEAGDQTCGESSCNWLAQRIAALVDVAQVEVGDHSVCVRRDDGAVLCWGWDGWLALGQGEATRTDRTSPVRVDGLPDDIVDMHASIDATHVCAVSTSKGIYCWGANYASALGHAPGAGSPADVVAPAKGAAKANGTPQLVGGTEGSRAVYVTREQTCGVKNDGSFFCIGGNRNGELGTGAFSQTEVTSPTAGLMENVASLGARHALCGLTNEKSVFCWGPTGMGESGSGAYWKTDGKTAGDAPGCNNGPCYATPRKLELKASSVSAGYGTVVALGADGAVYGWGKNDFGQAGHAAGSSGDQECTSASYPTAMCSPAPVAAVGLP